MWPETIKNIFLIVTCNITIIGTKESAVAQYLCCNPNWHSLECFSSKTRHRPKPVLRAWEGASCPSWRPPPVGTSPGSPCFSAGWGDLPGRWRGECSAWLRGAVVAPGLCRWRFGSGCKDSCFAKLGGCGERLLLLWGLLVGMGSFFISFYSWHWGGLFFRRHCLEETLLMRLLSFDGWK